MDLVVLGHKLNADGSIRPILRRRLRNARRVYRWGQPDHVVVSGGVPRNGQTEAQAMFEYLVSHNIPADRILKEDQSTTTLENARFVKNMGITNLLVLTSDYHAPRARYLFGQVYGREIPVRAVPAGEADVEEIMRDIFEPLAMVKAWYQTRSRKSF